ncbi:MAG: CDP-alcohol phosphatidyltransferase family protein [Ardenticatenaceae bacterium]
MTSIPFKHSETLTILRRRWLLTAVIYGSVLLLVYLFLQARWPYATRWALIATIVLVYSLWSFWRWLPENHREGESILLPTLGLGNILTLARGLLMPLVAGFIFSPWPVGALAWMPMSLYWLTRIADHFDGFLARRANHTTVLGAKLDMEFDSVGMWVVILLAIWYGQVPWWYIILALARYLFIFGIWWRERLGLPVYDLHPSVHRRIFAGCFMAFMSATLWPIVPVDALRLAGMVFFIPIALGFLRDWLVVIGRFDPNSASYQKVQRGFYLVFAKWGPLALRALLFVTMVMIYRALPLSTTSQAGILQPPTWVELFSTWHLPSPALLVTFVAVSGMLGTILTTLGFVGRLASLLLMFPIGFDIILNGLQSHNTIALITMCSIMLLSTGWYSLWDPDL